jgi:outer membrane protein OmpA-like peptidoglycan-associated protein
MANNRALAYFASLISVSVALGLCPSALAQSSVSPDAAELVKALKPKVRTRGLRRSPTLAETDRARKRQKVIKALKKKGVRGLSVEERTSLSEIVSDRPSVDLEIYFDYNSAAITSKAKPTLSSLGKALQAKELEGQSFLLAGHTDAKGGEEYNEELSKRRAAAVKKYLTKNFDLSDFELVIAGYGEEQLKVQDQPYAAANRRVQVVNMGETVAASD